jgi:amino acid transporter
VTDTIAVIVGVVIGSGIFMTPSTVAAGVGAFVGLAVLLAGVPLLLLTGGRYGEGEEKGT